MGWGQDSVLTKFAKGVLIGAFLYLLIQLLLGWP